MAVSIAHFIATVIEPSVGWNKILLEEWHKAMGAISEKAIIFKIDGAIVTLGVFDACWLQELHLLRPVLLSRINQMLDKPYIQEIRLKRIAQKQKLKESIDYKKTVQALSPIPLSPLEHAALQKIENGDLQEALLSFRQRCYSQ